MSQYTIKLNENTEILYGLDKPTGGYFWIEFQKNDDGSEEPVGDGKALTLTSLLSVLKVYGVTPDTKKLAHDFKIDEEPTSLQIRISKMFGEVNPVERLRIVLRDLVLCHGFNAFEG